MKFISTDKETVEIEKKKKKNIKDPEIEYEKNGLKAGFITISFGCHKYCITRPVSSYSIQSQVSYFVPCLDPLIL